MQKSPQMFGALSSRLLPYIAAALAIAIFVVDTFTPFGMAVAVLYVIVVLMAANFCDRRGLLLVSIGCAALTVLAFLLSHGLQYQTTAFARFLVSLAAIAIATILALKNKAGEAALLRSEAYLSEGQRLSQTGSFGWNVDSGDIVWSDETYRIFDLDRSVTPTIDLILERTHPDDLPAVRENIRRAIMERSQWQIEHRLKLPDGTIKFVNVVAHGSPDSTGQFEFVGAIMDETAAKKAEEDLHQARTNLAHVNRVTTLGEMTASIAHEVAQPIAAIVTNASAGLRWLSAQPPQLEETRKVLNRVLRDGSRANDVITRIRALSRKMPARKEPTSINALVEEVLVLTRAEAERGKVSVRTRLDRSLPEIAGDRVQLQQVILNLIVNAIEAMSTHEHPRRELQISSRMDGAGTIIVAVIDSGPGLEPEALDRLFDAFYTTKSQGIGMGLAICRSIIEAHEGKLWAEPHSEGGASFQFLLPVDADEALRANYSSS